MKKQVLIVFFILVSLVSGFLIARYLPQLEAINQLPEAEKIAEVLDCDLSVGPCNYKGLTLEIEERPVKPLVRHRVVLRTNQEIEEPVLDLKMVDMDMGVNRFQFSLADDGVWVSNLMIPVCSSGRRDWRASVYYTIDGKLSRVDFNLSVAGI